jgi:hypothetical protein
MAVEAKFYAFCRLPQGRLTRQMAMKSSSARRMGRRRKAGATVCCRPRSIPSRSVARTPWFRS